METSNSNLNTVFTRAVKKLWWLEEHLIKFRKCFVVTDSTIGSIITNPSNGVLCAACHIKSHASPNTSRVTRKHVRLNIHSFYFILYRHKEKASAAELSERASYVRPLETVLNQ